MPVNEYYKMYRSKKHMKNVQYFNFRDICNRNLWDTGYLVKKLQGYGILRPPNGASLVLWVFSLTIVENGYQRGPQEKGYL